MKIFDIVLFIFLLAGIGNTEGIETAVNRGAITNFATNTAVNSGTITNFATNTIEFTLYPVNLIVEPKELTIKAGEQFNIIVKTRYNNGDIKKSTNITYTDFSNTKAGNYNLKINADGLFTIVKLIVIPAEIVDMIINIKPIFYGVKCRVIDYFNVTGIDKYGNRIENPRYQLQISLKDLPSKLYRRLQASELTFPDGSKISTTHFQSGILILPTAEFIVYDLGQFIGTITINDIQKPINFVPQLGFIVHSFPFQLVDININNCILSVNYYVGSNIINREIKFPADWVDKFMKLTLIDGIEVLCYVSIEILKQSEIIYQDNYKEILKNTLFKPFFTLEKQ